MNIPKYVKMKKLAAEIAIQIEHELLYLWNFKVQKQSNCLPEMKIFRQNEFKILITR